MALEKRIKDIVCELWTVRGMLHELIAIDHSGQTRYNKEQMIEIISKLLKDGRENDIRRIQEDLQTNNIVLRKFDS